MNPMEDFEIAVYAFAGGLTLILVMLVVPRWIFEFFAWIKKRKNRKKLRVVDGSKCPHGIAIWKADRICIFCQRELKKEFEAEEKNRGLGKEDEEVPKDERIFSVDRDRVEDLVEQVEKITISTDPIPSEPRTITKDDGEFYYVDDKGNQVQITKDGRLNTESFGGAAGDNLGKVEINTLTPEKRIDIKVGRWFRNKHSGLLYRLTQQCFDRCRVRMEGEDGTPVSCLFIDEEYFSQDFEIAYPRSGEWWKLLVTGTPYKWTWSPDPSSVLPATRESFESGEWEPFNFGKGYNENTITDASTVEINGPPITVQPQDAGLTITLKDPTNGWTINPKEITFRSPIGTQPGKVTVKMGDGVCNTPPNAKPGWSQIWFNTGEFIREKNSGKIVKVVERRFDQDQVVIQDDVQSRHQHSRSVISEEDCLRYYEPLKKTKYKVGQWLRQKNNGDLKQIVEINPHFGYEGMRGAALRGVSLDGEVDDFFTCILQLDRNYERAFPKKYEWWKAVDCEKHRKLDKTPVQWDWTPGEHGRLGLHRDWIKCGCYIPVNFGRGETIREKITKEQLSDMQDSFRRSFEVSGSWKAYLDKEAQDAGFKAYFDSLNKSMKESNGTRFKQGQWVRDKEGSLAHIDCFRTGDLVEMSGRLWNGKFDVWTIPLVYLEKNWERAYPKNGEFWRKEMFCKTHPYCRNPLPLIWSSVNANTILTINEEEHPWSATIKELVNCGCFIPDNFGKGNQ